MRRTNTKVFKILTCFIIISVLLLGYLPVPANAWGTSKPAAPTGLALSAITNTSATLTWTVPTGATSYKVYKNGSSSAFLSPKSNTVQITNLAENTTNSFKVSAVNEGGEGAKSTAILLPAIPVGLAASAITQTSATLTWTDSTGATSYKVYKDGSLCYSPPGNTTQLTGLTAGTTYTFRVSSVIAGVVGAQSTAFTLTTLPVAPARPATPTGLAASAITPTSATLTWTAITGATSYNVYKDGSTSPCSSPPTNTTQITGLTAGTTYSFKVSAVNTGGGGAQSAALSVTTLPSVPLKVLEVQPGTTSDLTPSFFSESFPNYTIDLTSMSMAEFISKVDEINGQYDIVYIGNNTSGGSYTARGQAAAYLPITKQTTQNGSGTNSYEYYSDNDITNRRADTLKKFIDSKQLTIFDQSILGTTSSLAGTKLNSNFSSYVTSSPNHFRTVNRSSLQTTLRDAFLVYNNALVAKRPVLKLNSRPKQYDGTDDSYQAVKSLGYNFDINNQTTSNNMTVKLYIDINGDGIFKELSDQAGKSEMVYEMDNKKSANGYTINFHLPDGYIGLEPWKLELTDKSTGSRSYLTGATAFRGEKSGDEVNIRLLQLLPSDNTLSINSLRDVGGKNLLFKDKVYRIQVTEMSVANFNAAYEDLQTNPIPQPKPATVNGQSKTAPTVLNGNYDMMIMGFADSYGGDDLNANAIQALQSFIDTNQSVMFTHDTQQYHLPIDKQEFPGTYKLTESFRKLVGQQRYYRTAPDSSRDYDPMPNTQKDSYGYSNRLLDRFKTGSRVGLDTTTSTYKVNENFVTQFPFVLEDIPVASTHYQWFQLDLEDPNVVPVYTLYDNSLYKNKGDGRNDYYTYTKGSITYSGTGHSAVTGLLEKEMFINTMIKASRGANHAPTLDVNGISDGLNIANTLESIDFNFTATDIDLNDQYLNADIYLSKSTDGTNFSDYQNVKQFKATDAASRVISGEERSVSVPTVSSSIKAYKVKIVAYDSNNAQASQEIKLINSTEPSIMVQSSNQSCLVGDTINIPVSVTATATAISEKFQGISLTGTMTKPDQSSADVYNATYPDLTFSPNSSWSDNTQMKDFPISFNIVGDHSILNTLSYTALINNKTYPKEIDQSFKISVGSGTIEFEVLDQDGNGITGIPLTIGGTQTGTTNESGFASFAGLSSGTYTATITVPDGRAIDGSTSQTVNLSPSSPYKKTTFTLKTTAPATPLDLAASEITQTSCTLTWTAVPEATSYNVYKDDIWYASATTNTTPVIDLTADTTYSFKVTAVNEGGESTPSTALLVKTLPQAPTINPDTATFDKNSANTSAGHYTDVVTTMTLNGTTLSGINNESNALSGTTDYTGSDSTVTILKEYLVKQDVGITNLTFTFSDGSSKTLAVTVSDSKPETLISNLKITTRTGASAVSILKKVPIQGNVKLYLSREVKYLKMDFEASTVKIDLSNMSCDNPSSHQIDYKIDDHDKLKLVPLDPNATFPSGTYTFDALITEADLDLEINLEASAQDMMDYTESCKTQTTAGFLTITVGTAPPLH